MIDRQRAVTATAAALAVLAAVTAVVLAVTQLGVAGDTQCSSLVVRSTDPLTVCHDAVTSRWTWVVPALLVAVGGTALALLARRRSPSLPRPRRAALATAILLAVLVCGVGAYRLGQGTDDSCGSPITGAGAYPYEPDKSARCADTYSDDRTVGVLELVASGLVVGVVAVAVSRRTAVPA